MLMTSAKNSSMSDSTIPDSTALPVEEMMVIVEELLNDYHEPTEIGPGLNALYIFQQSQQQAHHSIRQVANRLLYAAWEELKEKHAEDATFIEKRFFDRGKMAVVARSMNVSDGHIFNIRRRAFKLLAHILLEQELSARAVNQAKWRNRLNRASYHTLFGLEERQKGLLPILISSDAPWLTIIEGIGGIGKTSLANWLVRQMIERCEYDDIGWISVQTQELLPHGTVVQRAVNNPEQHPECERVLWLLVAQLLPDFPLTTDIGSEQLVRVLDARFSAVRHLVVIDNLESVSTLEQLVPLLERFANPSRFILTSRERLPTATAAYRYVVTALSETESLALLRVEAELGGLQEFAQLSDEQLLPIYEAVGGNPLALRLVVGLGHTQSVSAIVAGLKEAPTSKIEELYRYIFWQAWQQLDETTKEIFIYMPLTNIEGDPLSIIVDAQACDRAVVQSELDRLVDLNLVNVHRVEPEYRYSIHSLTRTFLLNDAIQW